MMANKKTNMTAHVLSLMATEGTEAEIAEHYNEVHGVTNPKEENPYANAMEQPKFKTAAGKGLKQADARFDTNSYRSVRQTQASIETPQDVETISALIRQQLIKESEGIDDGALHTAPLLDTPLDNPPEKSSAPLMDLSQGTLNLDGDIPVFDTSLQDINATPSPIIASDEYDSSHIEVFNDEAFTPVAPVVLKPAFEDFKNPEIQNVNEFGFHAKKESDYWFVNVMEKIVRDKTPEYMKIICKCQCSRCQADAMALALSNLPPKYAVADKQDVYPLLQYHMVKLNDQITTQITAACMKVNESPHHDR